MEISSPNSNRPLCWYLSSLDTWIETTQGLIPDFSIAEMKKLLYLGLAILLVTWVRADDDEGEKKKDKESVGTVIGIDLGTTYSW